MEVDPAMMIDFPSVFIHNNNRSWLCSLSEEDTALIWVSSSSGEDGKVRGPMGTVQCQ